MTRYQTFITPPIEINQRWELRDSTYCHCVMGDIHRSILAPRGILTVREIKEARAGQPIIVCTHGGLGGWQLWFSPEGLDKYAKPASEMVPDCVVFEDCGGEAGGA